MPQPSGPRRHDAAGATLVRWTPNLTIAVDLSPVSASRLATEMVEQLRETAPDAAVVREESAGDTGVIHELALTTEDGLALGQLAAFLPVIDPVDPEHRATYVVALTAPAPLDGAAVAALQDLIPGKPGRVRALAERFANREARLTRIQARFKRVDAGGWQGDAATAFERQRGSSNDHWNRHIAWIGHIPEALEGYAAALEHAQGRAGEALELYRQGKKLQAGQPPVQGVHPDGVQVMQPGREEGPGRDARGDGPARSARDDRWHRTTGWARTRRTAAAANGMACTWR